MVTVSVSKHIYSEKTDFLPLSPSSRLPISAFELLKNSSGTLAQRHSWGPLLNKGVLNGLLRNGGASVPGETPRREIEFALPLE